MLFSKLEEYYIIFLMSDFIGCPQDRRRVEIEQKLEREAQQEKDEAARARKSLFQQRRSVASTPCYKYVIRKKHACIARLHSQD